MRECFVFQIELHFIRETVSDKGSLDKERVGTSMGPLSSVTLTKGRESRLPSLIVFEPSGDYCDGAA